MLWKPTYSRLFFSPDGDGGGGAGGDGGAQGSQNGQSQNGDASGQQGGDGQGGDQSKGAKMLSQDEVNKLIEERLTRAKSKWDKDAQTAAEKQKEAELPEIEQLRKRLEAAERDRDSLRAVKRDGESREAVRSAAKRLGATDDSVNAIYRMVKTDIEFDDEGKATNLADILAEAKQIAPQLFKPIVGKGDGGAGAHGKAKGNDWLRDLVASR